MRTVQIIIEQVETSIEGFMSLPKADKARLAVGYLILGISTAVYIGVDLIKSYFKI